MYILSDGLQTESFNDNLAIYLFTDMSETFLYFYFF